MPALKGSFVHLRGVLSEADLAFLTHACKSQLETESMPCFALLDRLRDPCYLKIEELVRAELGQSVDYLNDFYMYTDSSCFADWHMDTELYTFENTVNAWILLSPESVAAPLRILRDINQVPSGRYYHTLDINAGECEFGNLCTGESESMSQEELEDQVETAPEISAGDILLFDPRNFHRTNTDEAKHCHVIKFVLGGVADCLSKEQVPALFWPEVGIFNKLVAREAHWDGVLEGLRRALGDEDGRRSLSAGFYPDRFSVFKGHVRSL